MSILLSTDVAVVYARERGWKKLDSARALLEDIDKFMASKGLAQSTIDRYAVASHVLELQAQQIATPEEAAWSENLAQGTTADDEALRRMDELALAGQVQQMSMDEFSRSRSQLGLSQSLGDFLLGR